jgi:hypothetical protein
MRSCAIGGNNPMIPYMSSEFVTALISRPVPSQRENEFLCVLVRRLEGFMKASLMAFCPNRRLWAGSHLLSR